MAFKKCREKIRLYFYGKSDYAAETQDTQDDSDKSVQINQTPHDHENDTENRNWTEDTNQNTKYGTHYNEYDKCDYKVCQISFFYFKRDWP